MGTYISIHTKKKQQNAAKLKQHERIYLKKSSESCKTKQTV
jgi:hypothetical protein